VIDAVVKVGGSLGRGAGLPALCSRLAEAGRRRGVLVVPGGGAFADLVREHEARFGLRPTAAHWMAVLAMDQYGHLLAALTPGCALVRSFEEARACLAERGVAILLPSELLRRADPLPHSWAVTSDSIAAWVAREAGAPLLVLVKDGMGMAALKAVAPAAESMSADELVATRAVDEYFASLLREARFDLRLVDGERPERLAEALAGGGTGGVRIAPAGP